MSFQSKSELSFTDAHSVGQRYRPNTSQPSRKRKLPFDKILDRGVVLEAKRGKSDASDNFSMNDSAIDDELKDLGWRVLSGKSMFQIHGEIVVEDKLTQGMSKEIRSESNIPGTYVTKNQREVGDSELVCICAVWKLKGTSVPYSRRRAVPLKNVQSLRQMDGRAGFVKSATNSSK